MKNHMEKRMDNDMGSESNKTRMVYQHMRDTIWGLQNEDHGILVFESSNLWKLPDNCQSCVPRSLVWTFSTIT